MALNTFTPPRAPSPGTNRKVKAKLLEAEFGDGYTQAAPDGTNHLKSTATLSWELLTPTEAGVIISFIRAAAGYTPFYYTLSDDSTPLRWTCKEWDETRDQGGLRKITLNLIEYFGVLT